MRPLSTRHAGASPPVIERGRVPRPRTQAPRALWRQPEMTIEPGVCDVPARAEARAGSVRRFLAGLLRRSDFSVVLATLVLFVIFALGSESFLTPFNLFNMGRTAALYVFVAIGQAIVIVIGGMNLSLGAIGGLSVVMAGTAMARRRPGPHRGLRHRARRGHAGRTVQRPHHRQAQAELVRGDARDLVHLRRPGERHQQGQPVHQRPQGHHDHRPGRRLRRPATCSS